MPRYNVETLVDITRTNPSREDKDAVRNAQQQNFNSLLQGIGLRSNIDWNNDPQRVEYESEARWLWQFDTDRPDVFVKGNDPVGLLKEDLEGVPILKNLTNTAKLSGIFVTSGSEQNIWITQI